MKNKPKKNPAFEMVKTEENSVGIQLTAEEYLSTAPAATRRLTKTLNKLATLDKLKTMTRKQWDAYFRHVLKSPVHKIGG